MRGPASPRPTTPPWWTTRGWFDVPTSDQTKAKYGDLFCVNKAKDSAFLGLSSGRLVPDDYPPVKWFNNEFCPAPPADAMELLASRPASLAC